MNRLRPYGALVLATLAWGVEITVGKYAIQGLGAFTALFIEAGTAAAVLWVVMLRVRPHRLVPMRHYVLLGLIEPFACYGALNLGLRSTTAANAALLVALLPVMVLILGVVFGKDRVGRRNLMAGVIATAGAVMLATVHVTASVGVGDALVLLADLAAAGSVLIVSRLSAKASALEITAFQFGVGFLFTVPVAAVEWATRREAIPGSSELPHVAAAAAVGLGAFALAYLAYNYAVARVPVSTAGISLNLIPFFGVISAILWLGEKLSLLEWFAGALILGGILLFPHARDGPAYPDPGALPVPAPKLSEEIHR